MRYHSLRFIASLYHFIGVVIIGCAVVVALIMMVSAINVYVALYGSLSLNGLALAVLPGLGVFVVGSIMGVSAYAFGTLLIVIMDIEENTRKSDYSIPTYDEDRAPVAPKPWASFPPDPNLRPKQNKLVPRETYDERLRR